MMRRLLAALVTGLVFSFSGPASAETAALDAVRTSVEAILETITNEQLDETARREQMRAAIEDRFDFRGLNVPDLDVLAIR